jgi:hypothetical protein
MNVYARINFSVAREQLVYKWRVCISNVSLELNAQSPTPESHSENRPATLSPLSTLLPSRYQLERNEK